MPKRKSAKGNLYKNGVDTLSAHMTLSPRKSESNIDILRKILSVDTVLEDINQEEALEFLEAVECDIATERQEMKEALSDAESELKDLERSNENALSDLRNEIKELEDKSEFDLQIGTIEYRSSGIMDDMIMEALAEAYDWLTPLEIMDRLKISKLKTA